MTDKKQPLVSIPNTQPNTSLVAKPLGSNPVLRRMTDDALEWFRKKEIAAAMQRFRIGEYELCAPDYRQILHWAAQYAKSPEEVIAVLERSNYEICETFSETFPTPGIGFCVENGKITSLVWNFTEFGPTVADGWLVEKELSIAFLGFTGRSAALPSTLPNTVKCLGCSWLGLEVLDLFPVPGLTVLNCSSNKLKKLNIRSLRKLRELVIDENVRLIGTPPAACTVYRR